MIKKFIILIIILGIFNGYSFSQTNLISEKKENILKELDYLKKPNFYQTRDIYDQHWKNFDLEKPAGWKQFKRWEYFWENRVQNDGTCLLYTSPSPRDS